MLSSITLPPKEIPDVLTQSIDCLKIVFNAPILDTQEKLLWLWLVSQGVLMEVELVCSLSYQDISFALGYSTQAAHRALLRLKIMGFLSGDILIYYGPLSEEMIKQMRKLSLHLPEVKYLQKLENGSTQRHGTHYNKTTHLLLGK